MGQPEGHAGRPLDVSPSLEITPQGNGKKKRKDFVVGCLDLLCATGGLAACSMHLLMPHAPVHAVTTSTAPQEAPLTANYMALRCP